MRCKCAAVRSVDVDRGTCKLRCDGRGVLTLHCVLCCAVLACRPPEVVHDTDGLGSGCVLCHEPDFLRGAFGDRTIIICDTCEREFHVGCLREQNRADLKEVRGWVLGATQHTCALGLCH